MNKLWRLNIQYGDSSKQNYILYLEFAKRAGNCFHQKRKLYEMTDILVSLTVVNILQCIHVLKGHVVYLKYVQFLSIVTQARKKPKSHDF